MNIKTLIVGSLYLSTALQAIDFTPLVMRILGNEDMARPVLVATTAGLLSLYAYEKVSRYVENYCAHACAQAIGIALTSHTKINSLPEPERTQKLKKKARIIALRKGVLQNIEQFIASPDFETLSVAHKEAITCTFQRIKKQLALLDFIISPHCPEMEWQHSYIDALIERKVLSSFILSCKPDSECLQSELDQKDHNKAFRKTVINLVLKRIKDDTLRLMNFFTFFTAQA